MRSSYNKVDIHYGEFIESIIQVIQPKNILEIGILDGYSLNSMISSSSENTQICAYDLFDEFNGNHSNKDEMVNKFINNKNVKISYGDFYILHTQLQDKYDIIHIDIANTGEVLDYVMTYYYPKLTNHGIIIFEGGSVYRDQVEWMTKYNKTSIFDSIQKYTQKGMNIKTYGNMPSITLICNSSV